MSGYRDYLENEGTVIKEESYYLHSYTLKLSEQAPGNKAELKELKDDG